MRDVLDIEELFDCKSAVNASFHYAKDKSQASFLRGLIDTFCLSQIKMVYIIQLKSNNLHVT